VFENINYRCYGKAYKYDKPGNSLPRHINLVDMRHLVFRGNVYSVHSNAVTSSAIGSMGFRFSTDKITRNLRDVYCHTWNCIECIVRIYVGSKADIIKAVNSFPTFCSDVWCYSVPTTLHIAQIVLVVRYRNKHTRNIFVTHTGCIAADAGRAFDRVCLFVSVCMFVRALKAKRHG